MRSAVQVAETLLGYPASLEVSMTRGRIAAAVVGALALLVGVGMVGYRVFVPQEAWPTRSRIRRRHDHR
jgi:hypothetical protein